MADDDKPNDLEVLGSLFVVVGISLRLIFGSALRRKASSTTPLLPAAGAVPSPLPRAAKMSEAFFWTPEEQPKGLKVAGASKAAGWLTVAACILIIGGVVFAAAYLQIRPAPEDSVKANRPYVAVRVSAIEPKDGQFSTEETIDDYGKAAAINTELISQILPDAAGADEFFRHADAGTTGISPMNLGFVLPGKVRTYAPPPVASTARHYMTDAELAKDQSVTAVGRVTYQDFQGRIYLADFCFTRKATGSVQPCATHNMTK